MESEAELKWLRRVHRIGDLTPADRRCCDDDDIRDSVRFHVSAREHSGSHHHCSGHAVAMPTKPAKAETLMRASIHCMSIISSGL
jgi:hypothetical protein